MRKFKNLVIGGIENKVVNLILITVALLIVLFAVAGVYQNRTLTALSTEAGERQKSETAALTTEVLDTVTRISIDRMTTREARIVDEMFRGVKAQVTLLAQYAQVMFASPESYAPGLPGGPETVTPGRLGAYIVMAAGVEPQDLLDHGIPASSLADVMVSLCSAADSGNIYLGLEEGAFIKADTGSDTWFLPDGTPRDYDPRQRDWYRSAAEAGGLVFHINTEDFSTVAFCVEAAMPVYVDGQLRAVAGADIFRADMESVLQDAVEDGGYRIIVDQDGRVIYSPNEEIFHTYGSDSTLNLRQSTNEALSALVNDAFEDKTDVRLVRIEEQDFYMIGAPIPSAGWVLLSAFGKEQLNAPVVQLQASYDSVQMETVAAYRAQSGRAQTTIIVAVCLLTALMLAMAIVLGKRIVKPLNAITNRLANLREGDMEFKMEDTYRTGDEIEVLAESFATISHKTVQYVHEVTRVTAEKERISTELHMANQIQESMLPSIFPAFPDRREFDIYATMEPAKEVGGDFYDFFLIDEDHLCMVMADVSGKGVPAALFMMASKIILQSCAMLGSSPAEILAKTNEAICSNNKMQMFVTVWLGILEISTGKLTTASAGHEYPALQQGCDYALYRDKHGFVIGGLDGVRYKECEIQLQPGDRIFVYTDGVPEATNASNELFGTQRMLDALNENPEASPEETLHDVRRAVNAFVNGAEQFDDLTMMCLLYRGPKDGAAQRSEEITARSSKG